MRKFVLASLALAVLSAFVANADTVTVTNRGQVITVNTMSEGTNIVGTLEQAVVLPSLKVLDDTYLTDDIGVGGDMHVWGKTYVDSGSRDAVGNRSSGYFVIDGTNLLFRLVATNGATAAVELATPKTYVVITNVIPTPY